MLCVICYIMLYVNSDLLAPLSHEKELIGSVMERNSGTLCQIRKVHYLSYHPGRVSLFQKKRLASWTQNRHTVKRNTTPPSEILF